MSLPDPKSESGSRPSLSLCPGCEKGRRWDEPPVLRGEILSPERLVEHAAEIARAHGEPGRSGAPRLLWQRFVSARSSLREAYAVLNRELSARRDPSPAQEWLLDNSHVVEEQFREIEEDLPGGYLRELPRLSDGAMRGCPSVYGLCVDYLRHTDARVDLNVLCQYVQSYQSVRQLTIGELWAVPIMLRLGLLLTVSAIASAETSSRDRPRGNEWADRLLADAKKPTELPLRLLELERGTPITAAFLVQLSRRLREHDDSALGVVSDWIALQSGKLGAAPEELVRRQLLRQAADQVSVGNAVTSMRAIAAFDWHEFFERTSAVEALLGKDPALAYAVTDPLSRDRYRHAVEGLARRGRSNELGVAQAALELSQRKAQGHAQGAAEAHVGYYLLDDGRRELERRVAYRARLSERFRRAITTRPAAFYFGGIGLVAAALCAVAAAYLGAPALGAGSILMVLLLAMPALELAIEFMNGLTVSVLKPRLLPRFAFKEGIPHEHRALVAVPALLESPEVIDRLLEDLEVRSLGNADEHLYFALLTDFVDAGSEEMPGDAALLERVEQGIAALNERHGGDQRYWLFHRRRVQNPIEGRFMGWDRKRGKLEELNRLLRGATDTTFSSIRANTALFPAIRYVITLDADTDLPRDTARKLVATLAHPLNRPVVDRVKQRVVRGYGVAQPRVGTLPQSSRESRFAAIAAGPPGIDPYTTAVSDVYQDLFGEGSYVGKGIYDVDAFSAVLENRVPENLLLSHDLFEGLFARSALVTDVEVLDEQPAAYEVQASRQHRWIRGDWQLVQWLLPRVPTREGKRRASDLRALDWWKLFDNLRRSLLGAVVIAICLMGWFGEQRQAIVSVVALAAVLFAPLLLRLVFQLARDSRRLSPSLFGALGGDVRSNAIQVWLSLVVLLDQALVSVDAIVRALYRLFWSKRRLMEWRTMRQSARLLASGGAPARTWFSAGLSLLIGVALLLFAPDGLLFAAPVLVCWMSAPAAVGWLSRPLPKEMPAEQLSASDRRLLRVLGAKTWRYFETFVTERDNHLPPDNYQEDPRGVVAHRTSPTNIGLYLLSTVAARDLGHITLGELRHRLGNTLGTLERIERRFGHVLNWYDTESLRPLEPQYVSTVDSGNLVAALWTLRQACDEFCDAPLVGPEALEAAADVIAIAQELLEKEEPHAREAVRDLSLLERRLREAAPELSDGPKRALELLAELAGAVHAAAKMPNLRHAPTQVRVELARAEAVIRGWLGSTRALAPFVEALQSAPKIVTEGPLAPAFGRLSVTLLAARSLSELRSALEFAQGARAGFIDLDSAEMSVGERDAAEAYLGELMSSCARASAVCLVLGTELRQLATRALALADAMDFRFLFDEARELFVTGYNVSSVRLDTSHYDLLASEARVASLIAVAKGEVPQEHWFRLGRPRTAVGSRRCLLSWSGSMFEFLMPLLVTKNNGGTLLRETCESAVLRQCQYGTERGVPWGISESSYNVMDFGMTYQYRAFGVPGLGLKAGLGEDLVIAPYATALAAMVRPELAVKNLRALSREGADGAYGHYEAIDYTPTHVPPGRKSVVVKSFMAHHQGMTLVAIDNVLNDFTMPARFHRDARIKASELLLEERVPVRAPLTKLAAAAIATTAHGAPELDLTEHVGLGAEGGPRLHLLGHGELSTLVSSTGGGVTTWKGIDVNRFREDPVLEAGGIYVYIRNLSSQRTWSAGYQPTCAKPDSYDASFAIDRVELHRRDGFIETTTEILPSPEHPAEVRRITLTNHGDRPIDIDLTSYTEVVLAARGADLAHRVFGSLFIETEVLPERGALLARRRPRSPGEEEVWLVQLLTGDDDDRDELEFDTSRESFVGRGRDLRDPAAVRFGTKLARNIGRVLDPALSLRRRIRLLPGKSVRRSLVTGLANSRERALELVEQYSAPHGVSRTFELAWADARVELKHLGITAVEVHRFQRLLSAVVYPRVGLRSRTSLPRAQGRAALWSQGISGDLPIVVLRMDQPDFGDLCRELLLAHEFWRLNGINVDLVLLDEEPGGYVQPLWEAALGLIRSTHAEGQVDQRGGVHLRRGDTLNEDQRGHLLAVARAVLVASRGSLSRQLRLSTEPKPLVDSTRSLRALQPVATPVRPARPQLSFDNGIGGFDESGGEYVIVLAPGSVTPAPWSNVLSNEEFGCVVTEAGSSFTWFANSQRHRLTPWSNDPVVDPSGELLYLRDEEDGSIWSPTPRPLGASEHFVVRHGQGYSSFEHTHGQLEHRLSIFVSPSECVKVYRLQLRNLGSKTRRLSVFALVEWVLGANREHHRLSVITSWDREAEALFATNPLSTFHERHAFLSSTRPVRAFTADREEFFGLAGSRQRPKALEHGTLSGRHGAGLDPCAALQVAIELRAGESLEVSFVLGDAEDRQSARSLASKYRNDAAVVRTFDEAVNHWDQLLSAVKIKTPDPALDLMMNRWLVYQVTSCRLWGRSAFYQSSGAYGFRDQLQDVMALLHTRPELARAHILRSAARQFSEGDVQHWWHPEGGEGVRTHCSDDFLWLPLVVSEYVRVTGDRQVLDEIIPFLSERPLSPSEDDLFSSPRSTDGATLYEHCTRALDRGKTAGAHGLPKIGSCDWNDGMNRVGALGEGESVWLAWFYAKTLAEFSDIAREQRDLERVAICQREIERMARAVDEHAWDGSWYRRAYFDDGTPLGTSSGDECRIDAIAQSWAVISGIGDASRASLAVAKSEELLLREEPKTMLLLWPPFEHTPHDPGYIKSYPPGVRENGGQYTHGVLWTLQALARLGEGDRAGRLMSLLNPVQHALTRTEALRYRVEPYVVAADVYSAPGHEGRGGWTWYTGAAGWMYRIVLEWILGLRRRGAELSLSPCVPRHWSNFEIEYRFQKSVYVIRIENPNHVTRGVREMELDGQSISGDTIELEGSGVRHEVRVLMASGEAQSPPYSDALSAVRDEQRRAPD